MRQRKKTQKLDAFGQPMYEKQALDKFGQKMYKEQKVDAFGTKMYKVILSEPASYHEDSDKNGICDRCSAPYSGSETAPETPVDPGTPEPETPVDPGTQEPETPVDPETPAPETPVDPGTQEPGTQEPETPAPETPEQPETTEETQPQSEETEAVDPASVEESPTTAKVVLRPFYFLSAAAVVEKIVYDETSAPIYDETSAPIYDTTSAPVYETVSAPTYTGWQTIDGKTYYFDKNGNKVTGYQVINGVAYTFNSEGVRQGNIGIDVSKYQTGINWKKVKNAGIDFVMIRCGYRGYGSGVLVEDPMFASHISGAKAAGLRVGVYFFSQAVNEAEAVEEASMAVTLARKYGINMPIAIDSEYAANGAGRADKLSKSQRTAVTKAFCNTVRNAGYTPMVYASKSWFETHLNASQLSGYKIWVAHYAEKCGYSGRYDIWQNTDKGKVDGIPGYVDMNIGTL